VDRTLLINFNTFLPKAYVDLGGFVILLAVVSGIIFALYRWRGILSERLSAYSLPSRSNAKILALSLTVDILYQKSIADCSRARWFAHMAMFWGFLGLAVTTTLDAILNPTAAPLPLSSPVRILGNISGVFFVGGVSYSLFRRFTPSVRSNSTSGDLIFLSMLLLAGLSGFVTEAFSSLNLVYADSYSYWIHLILVAGLLVSAPFTKFVHAIGRPILLLIRRRDLTRELDQIKTTAPVKGENE
jgi:nitrate reductase gamma subunit